MWFWQRKEVWVGNSMQEFSRLRELLSQNGIRYDYRIGSRQKFEFDRRLTGLARMGSSPRFDTTYTLYVRREDFEYDCRLLNGSPD